MDAKIEGLQKINLMKAKQVEMKVKSQEVPMEVKLESGEKAKRLRPPTFDGQVPWMVFKHQFESVAKHNKWTEEEKATELIMTFQGKAVDLMQTMLECRDYTKPLETTERRLWEKFFEMSRVQKPGETLQELEADVRRLAYLAYPHASAEFLETTINTAFGQIRKN